MDMNARNQYLEVLQEKYFVAKSRKEKSQILDEYCQNTGQHRKYVIRKIRSPLHRIPTKRKRASLYDAPVRSALAKIWEIFDFPCGQRLKPLLETELSRLRRLKEVTIPDEVAEKLSKVSARTIDRLLRHQREVLHLQSKRHQKRNPLIYLPFDSKWYILALLEEVNPYG